MTEATPSPSRLPRIVKQLGSVSFFNDFASEMVYPLLPALVTTRLGGSALALGALDGVADAAAAGVKLGSGWLAEHVRWRRPLVIGGYLVAAVVRPVMGVAGAAWQVIALRAADRVGKGVRSPARDAVIADASPGALRGRAFGLHRGMDHAGAVVGPLVAWVLIAGAGAAPEEVIVWSLAPGVLAVMVVVWAVSKLGERGTGNGERHDGEKVVERGSSFLLFGLIVAFAFARFPETLLLLRLQDLGVEVALIPVLWAALHVVRSVMSYPGGWLSDFMGPRRTMVVGWVIYATVCFGLARTGSATIAALWFLLFGLVAAATEAPERAYVAAAGDSVRRGRRFGGYHAAVGMVALPGGLLFGALYAGKGGVVALTVSGAIAALICPLGAWRRA
jgi:MFS family permease